MYFMWHAEGLWRAEYKDGFARLLLPDVKAHPKLIKSIVGLGDRVFSMVAYRAAELASEEGGAQPVRPRF